MSTKLLYSKAKEKTLKMSDHERQELSRKYKKKVLLRGWGLGFPLAVCSIGFFVVFVYLMLFSHLNESAGEFWGYWVMIIVIPGVLSIFDLKPLIIIHNKTVEDCHYCNDGAIKKVGLLFRHIM